MRELRFARKLHFSLYLFFSFFLKSNVILIEIKKKYREKKSTPLFIKNNKIIDNITLI